MTREDEFIGQLEGYLDDYEGLTPLPEAVRDAIRAELPRTKQIGVRPGPMRYLSLSTSIPAPARYALVAAAVMTAAILGTAFIARAGNIGAHPTPSPTPTSPALIQPHDGSGGFGPLAAGTYYADIPFPVRVAFEVPQGWQGWAYTSAGSQINLNPSAGSGEVSVEIVDNIAADPCTRQLLDPPVGPSVDDLVTALSNMEGFDASPATDVTISGFAGKQFTLTAPDRDPLCQSMLTWKTTTRQNGVGPGEVNEVQIVDVDGVRLLICTAYTPPISAGNLSELQAVADSVRIGR
jgi:hypothetical protein